MKLTILCLLLLPAFSSLALAQDNRASQSVAPGKCTVPLASAPELRGLRLGMSQAQVLARFPGLTLDKADEFGLTRLLLAFIDSDLYPKITSTRDRGVQIDLAAGTTQGRSFTVDSSRFPTLKGVRRIQLSFVDGRATYVQVAYDDSFKWNSLEEFATTVSKILGLPDDWRDDSDSDGVKRGKGLRCDGFKMTAQIGGDATDSRVGSQLSLEDTALAQLIEKRRKEKEEKAKRDEEERRKTFKP